MNKVHTYKNHHIFSFSKIFLFSIILILIGSVNAIQLDRQQRIALQTKLKNILNTQPPVNIPRGGRWDNHYCDINGAALSNNGPDRNHNNVLKIIVKVLQDETIEDACQRKMREVIRMATNRLVDNAEVTLQAGEYTITPLDNNGHPTTFRCHCYDPRQNNIIQGPRALVLQFNVSKMVLPIYILVNIMLIINAMTNVTF